MRIKGADAPVARRRQLLAIEEHQPTPSQRVDPGRADLGTELPRPAILDEAIGGAGCVVNIVGPPGIGKSRLARETAALAAIEKSQSLTVHCESHTSDVPFRARLANVFAPAWESIVSMTRGGRAQVRAWFSDADPDDLPSA